MILEARNLTLAHGRRVVVRDVSLGVSPGEVVALVGPNGSGKTTLLRGMARLHSPKEGSVFLDGTNIREMGSRAVARSLAMLPQAPEGGLDLTVTELAWRGRYPHQNLLLRARPEDYEAVKAALAACDLVDFADRLVGQLSGGERQRAWLAMALAQRPRVLLLDEPTSFLDFEHQLQVMEIISTLRAREIAVVAVLHDLQLASRYSDRIVALHNGTISFEGAPSEVLKEEALERVFNVRMRVIPSPVGDAPLAIPAELKGRSEPGVGQLSPRL